MAGRACFGAGAWQGGPTSDSFVAIHRDAFHPAAPSTNLVQVANHGGIGYLSRIVEPLRADTQYFLIFSTYDNGMKGASKG